ncbi:MAG TPA: hypothetical protein VGM82_25060 [Gemmatimonadaceae bacterium]|jgi:hypothetical protein
MLRHTNRARWLVAGAALLASPLFSACDVKEELLQPQNPGIIDPASTDSPAAAVGLRVASLGQLKSRTAGSENGFWMYSGLLADEWKSSDTFSQRNETDQRSIQTNNANIQNAYNSSQQSRGYIRTAIEKSVQFTPDAKSDIAEMWFALGFMEMSLAENYCNGVPISNTKDGIPQYGNPLTNAEIFAIALTHFDSALTLAQTDTKGVLVTNAAKIAKARTQLNLGQQTTAATTVNGIATTYTYTLTFDQTTGDQQLWSLNNSAGRYTVGDSVDNITGRIPNALPFFSAKDLRVPTLSPTSPKPFDATTPLRTQQIYPGRSDPIPLVSGIDARLIEAEAQMSASNFTGMMATLNALRTSGQKIGPLTVAAMPALTATPATKNDAMDILYREWAFWTFGRGQRLENLRREIRVYGRTQDQLFPTGAFHKGGNFGTDVNLPVPDAELTNPNFHGCIDRKA